MESKPRFAPNVENSYFPTWKVKNGHMNKGKWLGKYSRPMEHLGRNCETNLEIPMPIAKFFQWHGISFGRQLLKNRFPFFLICLFDGVWCFFFLGSIYSGWLGIILVLSDIPKALYLWRFRGGVVDGGPWFFNWYHFTTKKTPSKEICEQIWDP